MYYSHPLLCNLLIAEQSTSEGRSSVSGCLILKSYDRYFRYTATQEEREKERKIGAAERKKKIGKRGRNTQRNIQILGIRLEMSGSKEKLER